MKQRADAKPISDLLATLADPTRLRVLRLLEAEELSVGEVAKVVQLPQSTVSRQLKVLAEAGWLARRAAGPATLYKLVLDDLDTAARGVWLAARPGVDASWPAEEDHRRLASVLLERRLDSQAFFGRVAGEWDEMRTRLFGSSFTARALLGLLPSGWSVADVGCGTGNAAELLAPVVERVVAIDRSEPMLDAARRRLASARNVEFAAGSLERLPLPDRSVDAAVCVLVLHHVEEPSAALAEMRRVLRTDRGGGVALVVDMVEHRREEYRQTMGHRHLGFSASRMREMMWSAGFGGEVRVADLPGDPDGRGPGLFVATARV